MNLVTKEQFVCVWDSAVPSKVCRSIIKHHNSNPNRQAGVIGKGGVDLAIKNSVDSYYVFPNVPSFHNQALVYLRRCLNDYIKLYPDAKRVNRFDLFPVYNVQHYRPKCGYPQRHCERDGNESSHRHLVFMIYLNTVTDQGGTAFPNQDLVMDAVAGRVVIWPSDWTHAHHGIISPTQDKYIMTGWYSYV